MRKKADKPRWYRGNFVIEIFVLSDSLIGVVAEDFFAGKTRGKIALPREFEWRSNADRHIREFAKSLETLAWRHSAHPDAEVAV